MPHPKIQEDESFVRAPSSKYCRISQHTKNKLCYMVIEKKIKVNSAAKILKINQSTAKLIVRQFNQLNPGEQTQVLISGSIPKALKHKNEDKKIKRMRKKQKVQEQKNQEQGNKKNQRKLQQENKIGTNNMIKQKHIYPQIQIKQENKINRQGQNILNQKNYSEKQQQTILLPYLPIYFYCSMPSQFW